nr:hypothetical protein [Vibrio mimicus]
MDEIQRFDQTLLDNIEFIKVKVNSIKPDETIKELFDKANPLSGLRTSSETIDKSAYLFNLLSLQSPIICYRYRKQFKSLTGTFTLTKLQCITAQHHSEHSIHVFVLKKKPALLRNSVREPKYLQLSGSYTTHFVSGIPSPVSLFSALIMA